MGVTVSPVQQVVANGLCAGCGLCANIGGGGTASMQLGKAGFFRPLVASQWQAAQEATFRSVCPGLLVQHPTSTAVASHPIWGPLVEVRAGHALDAEVRHQGSSGGGISALAIWLLESQQVDFVAQIAVSATDPLRNELQLSRSRADVLRAAGSRYAPSAPLEHLHSLLNLGQRFAFVGKPCDVAALRNYALHDPRVNQRLVCALSFMCAGVPSLHGTHELLAKLGTSANQLKSFRYRGDGWPGKARAVTHDGQVLETDYNNSWGTVLNKHLQFRCKICPDGTGEFADIVCADAWYGKDGYPDFTERDGRSLILSRSAAGEALLRGAMQAGAIAAEPLPVAEIARMQPYQVNRKQMVLARLLGTRLALGTAPRYKRLGLWRAALSAPKLEWLRNAWGTYKRAKGEPT